MSGLPSSSSSPHFHTLTPYPSLTEHSSTTHLHTLTPYPLLTQPSQPPRSHQHTGTHNLTIAPNSSSGTHMSLGAMSQLMDSHLSQIMGELSRADTSGVSSGSNPSPLQLSSTLLNTLSSLVSSSTNSAHPNHLHMGIIYNVCMILEYIRYV